MKHSMKRALALLLALLLAVPAFAFAEPLDNELDFAFEEEAEADVAADESVGEISFDLSELTEEEPAAPPADDDAEAEVDLDDEEPKAEEEESAEDVASEDAVGDLTEEETPEEEIAQDDADEAGPTTITIWHTVLKGDATTEALYTETVMTGSAWEFSDTVFVDANHGNAPSDDFVFVNWYYLQGNNKRYLVKGDANNVAQKNADDKYEPSSVWTTNSEGKAELTITGKMDIFSEWKLDTGKAVTFTTGKGKITSTTGTVSNNGTMVSFYNVLYGQKISDVTISDYTGTAGYSLENWHYYNSQANANTAAGTADYVNATNANIFQLGTTQVTQNTLYMAANWTADKFTVYFVDKDGSTPLDSIANLTAATQFGVTTETVKGTTLASYQDNDGGADYPFYRWVNINDSTDTITPNQTDKTVTGTRTYKRTYSSAYEVYWTNLTGEGELVVEGAGIVEGTDYEHEYVRQNANPQYNGTTPKKAPDGQDTYVWTGKWKEYKGDAGAQVANLTATGKYYADGSIPAIKTAGVYVYAAEFAKDGKVVASYNNKSYATFKEAYDAAVADSVKTSQSTEKTITLLDNVTLADALTLSSSSKAAKITITAASKYSITATSAMAGKVMFTVPSSAVLTLNNIDVDGNNTAAGIVVNSGKLTMTASSVKNGEATSAYNGGVTLNGIVDFTMDSNSAITNNSAKSSALYDSYGADLYVNDGNLSSLNKVTVSGAVGKMYIAPKTVVTMASTATATHAYLAYEKAKLIVTTARQVGYLVAAQSSGSDPLLEKVSEAGTNNAHIEGEVKYFQSGLAVAKYTDNTGATKYYYSLADALADASTTGATITLINPVTLAAKQAIGKNVTIDLGTYKVTGTAADGVFEISAGNTVTIKNGTIENTATAGVGIIVPATAVLNLKGTALTAKGYGLDVAGTAELSSSASVTSSASYGINDTAGIVTIKDGAAVSGTTGVVVTNATLTVEDGAGTIAGIGTYNAAATAAPGTGDAIWALQSENNTCTVTIKSDALTSTNGKKVGVKVTAGTTLSEYLRVRTTKAEGTDTVTSSLTTTEGTRWVYSKNAAGNYLLSRAYTVIFRASNSDSANILETQVKGQGEYATAITPPASSGIFVDWRLRKTDATYNFNDPVQTAGSGLSVVELYPYYNTSTSTSDMWVIDDTANTISPASGLVTNATALADTLTIHDATLNMASDGDYKVDFRIVAPTTVASTDYSHYAIGMTLDNTFKWYRLNMTGGLTTSNRSSKYSTRAYVPVTVPVTASAIQTAWTSYWNSGNPNTNPILTIGTYKIGQIDPSEWETSTTTFAQGSEKVASIKDFTLKLDYSNVEFINSQSKYELEIKDRKRVLRITYDALNGTNGASNKTTKRYAWGDTVTAPDPAPIKAGSVFKNWHLPTDANNRNFFTYYDDGQIVTGAAGGHFTADLELVAYYETTGAVAEVKATGATESAGYTTFAAALAAANEFTNGATITLKADITTEQTMGKAPAAQQTNVPFDVTGKVTIDLNDKTFGAENCYPALTVNKTGATLTITDSDSTATVGKYVGTIAGTKGSVTLDGGVYEFSGAANMIAMAATADALVIKGGAKVTASNTGDYSVIVLNNKSTANEISEDSEIEGKGSGQVVGLADGKLTIKGSSTVIKNTNAGNANVIDVESRTNDPALDVQAEVTLTEAGTGVDIAYHETWTGTVPAPTLVTSANYGHTYSPGFFWKEQSGGGFVLTRYMAKITDSTGANVLRDNTNAKYTGYFDVNEIEDAISKFTSEQATTTNRLWFVYSEREVEVKGAFVDAIIPSKLYDFVNTVRGAQAVVEIDLNSRTRNSQFTTSATGPWEQVKLIADNGIDAATEIDTYLPDARRLVKEGYKFKVALPIATGTVPTNETIILRKQYDANAENVKTLEKYEGDAVKVAKNTVDNIVYATIETEHFGSRLGKDAANFERLTEIVASLTVTTNKGLSTEETTTEYFGTFAAAVTAANAVAVATTTKVVLQLLKDNVAMPNGAVTTVKGKWTLDLNGKTLKPASAVTGDVAIKVGEPGAGQDPVTGELTIIDSSTGKTGNINFNLTATGIDVYAGSLTVRSGILQYADTVVETVATANNQSVYIYGGELIGATKSVYAQAGKIFVQGGKLTGAAVSSEQNLVAKSEHLQISGLYDEDDPDKLVTPVSVPYFTAAVNDKYCRTGWGPAMVEGATDAYKHTVAQGANVTLRIASIKNGNADVTTTGLVVGSDVKFTKVSEAIKYIDGATASAENAPTTIVVTANIAIDGEEIVDPIPDVVEIVSKQIANNVTLNKDITLDLCETTMTNNGDYDTITVGKNNTLSLVSGTSAIDDLRGTVANTSAGKSAIVNKGTVAITGADVTITHDATAGDTIVNYGMMTLTGAGKYVNEGAANSVVKNMADADTTIENSLTVGTPATGQTIAQPGGEFKGGKYNVQNDMGGDLVVYGASFNAGKKDSTGAAANTAALILNENKATIYAGTFTADNAFTRGIVNNYTNNSAKGLGQLKLYGDVAGAVERANISMTGMLSDEGIWSASDTATMLGTIRSYSTEGKPTITLPSGYAWVKDTSNGELANTFYVTKAVAEMNGDYYTSISAAIGAIANNGSGTITLIADTLEYVEVGSNKTVTIDLKGHNIYCDKRGTFNGETVTALDTHNTITVAQGSVLNLKNSSATVGTINNGFASVATPSGFVLYNSGTVNVEKIAGGGQVKFAHDSTLDNSWTSAGSATGTEIYNAGTLTINDAIVENGGVYSNAIENASTGDLTINGGEFKGGIANILNKGDLKVNGGTFTAIKVTPYGSTDSWTSSTKALIINDNVTGGTYAATLKITGAAFQVSGNAFTKPIMNYIDAATSHPNGSIALSGTITFDDTEREAIYYYGETLDAKKKLVPIAQGEILTGGAEYSTISGIDNTLGLPSGYIWDDIGNNKFIVTKGGVAYVEGDKSYATLAAAITAIANKSDKKGTITLKASLTDDKCESVTFPAGTEIILDLNGQSITNVAGRDTITVSQNAKLTIIDKTTTTTTTGATITNVTNGKSALVNNGTVVLGSEKVSSTVPAYFGGTYTNGATGNVANVANTIVNNGEMTVYFANASQTGTTNSLVKNGTNGKLNFVTNKDNAKTSSFDGGKYTIENAGTLVVDEGTFNGITTAVVANTGTATLNGGTFSSGTKTNVLYNISGEMTLSDKLALTQGASAAQVTKDAGTVKSLKRYPVLPTTPVNYTWSAIGADNYYTLDVAVAAVGATKYSTIADAINSNAAAKTVNVDVVASHTISEALIIPAGVTVNLDLASWTVTANKPITVNGTLNLMDMGTAPALVAAGTTRTYDGAIVAGSGLGTDAMISVAATGTVAMTNTTIYSGAGDAAGSQPNWGVPDLTNTYGTAIAVAKGGTLTMNHGIVTGKSCAVQADSDKVNIYGGLFKTASGAPIQGTGAGVVTNNGTKPHFTAPIDSALVAGDYACTTTAKEKSTEEDASSTSTYNYLTAAVPVTLDGGSKTIDGKTVYGLFDGKDSTRVVKVPYGETLTVPAVELAGQPTYSVSAWKTAAGTDFDLTHVFASTDAAMTLTAQWAIDLAKSTITAEPADASYTGAAQKPTLKIGTKTLVEGTDYTVTSSTPDSEYKNAGTYTIALAGKGDYTGAATATYTIAKLDITPVVTIADYAAGATPSTPAVTGNTGEGAVTYTYAAKGSTEFTATAPTTGGNYTIKAAIAATTNYNAGEATADFVVGAAEVDGKQYATFAEAAEAAKTATDPTIELHEDVADAYTLTDGEILNVKLDGKALTVKTADGTVVEGEFNASTGITTYTSNVTVTFDTDGGTEIEPQTIPSGTTAKQPVDPEKDGYKFVKWVDAEGADFDFDKAITADTTVKAVWTTYVWIRSRNAILEGAVSLQIKVEPLDATILADAEAKVVFSFEKYPEDNKTILLSEYSVDENTGRYCYSAPIMLARYFDKMTVTFEHGDGTPIEAVVGSTKDDCTAGYSFSLEELCDKNRGEETASARLYEALLDYGIASQINFQQGDWQSVTVDEHVTSVTLDDMKDIDDTKTGGTKPEGVTAAMNASCEADHTMNVTFTLPKPVGNYTFTLDSKPVDPVEADGKYRVQVVNIAADELAEPHVISISDGTNTYTVTTSLMAYFKNKVKKGTPEIANMGKAIFNYNKAAVDYATGSKK